MQSERAKQKNNHLMRILWEQTVNPEELQGQDKLKKSQVLMTFYIIVFEW